jgi:deaminated glutathione amidase
MIRMAIVQMISTSDLEDNLTKMERFISEAVGQGATVVAFPELAYFSGTPQQTLEILPRYSELREIFGAWAKQHSITLIPGTIREPIPAKPNKQFNTQSVFDPSGRCVGEYRKIFLFRAALTDRSYDETLWYEAGSVPVVVPFPWGVVGLGICFDLRFPELFRFLRKRGAQFIFLPSAFTVPTGQQHWKPLILARAIENQVFFIAPAQAGKSGEAAQKYGHSLIVSPWGETLVEMGDEEGVRVVEVDLQAIQTAQSSVNAWECRREDLFPIS